MHLHMLRARQSQCGVIQQKSSTNPGSELCVESNRFPRINRHTDIEIEIEML